MDNIRLDIILIKQIIIISKNFSKIIPYLYFFKIDFWEFFYVHF